MMQTPIRPAIKSVFVTGATGFLGAWILPYLISDGYEVTAIKRKHSPLPAFISQDIVQKVNWLEADVLDVISLQDTMQDMDAVIHAAALVSFQKSERPKMYTTNVQGTANVVNIAIEAGVKRMVYISSVAAIGRTREGEMVDEEKKWIDNSLNTHYAISKYRAEMEMWRAMAEGLDGVIINPSTILGYGNWNTGSCAIFKNVYDEFPWYTRGLNGFVYVEDVARLVVALLKGSQTNERFIVNGDNWTFRQLLDTMAEGFGKRPPYREAGPLLSQLAWRWEKMKSFVTGKQPLLSRETALIAQSRTSFSNKKILDAVPDFQFTPLQTAILQSCRQYQQPLKG